MTGTDDTAARPDAHLRDIADGCGCAEVWEHTSAAREEDAESDEEEEDEMPGVDGDEGGVRRVDGGADVSEDGDGNEDGVDAD